MNKETYIPHHISEGSPDFIPFYNPNNEFHYAIVVDVNYTANEQRSEHNLTLRGTSGLINIKFKGLIPQLLNTVGDPLIMIQKNVESEDEEPVWILSQDLLVFGKDSESDLVDN